MPLMGIYLLFFLDLGKLDAPGNMRINSACSDMPRKASTTAKAT